MTAIKWCWMAWVLVGFAIEATALYEQTPGNTLSEIVWTLTKQYPIFALAIGVLMGHFFWQAVIKAQ